MSPAKKKPRPVDAPSKKSRGGGHKPTKCTPEFTEQLAQLVTAGAPIPLACAYLKISYKTVQDWFSEAYREREPYRTFITKVEQAKAAHAIGCQMRITKAGVRGSWQADLAILERRHPEYWRARQEAQEKPPDGLDGLTAGQILDLALGGKRDG